MSKSKSQRLGGSDSGLLTFSSGLERFLMLLAVSFVNCKMRIMKAFAWKFPWENRMCLQLEEHLLTAHMRCMLSLEQDGRGGRAAKLVAYV